MDAALGLLKHRRWAKALTGLKALPYHAMRCLAGGFPPPCPLRSLMGFIATCLAFMLLLVLFLASILRIGVWLIGYMSNRRLHNLRK